jgi:transcriptional regulator with XRE-family HTH domain
MDDLNLGERITLQRRRLRMTQQQLAAVMGITATEIYRLESGLTKDPHCSRILALAHALKTTPNWLLGFPSDDD